MKLRDLLFEYNEIPMSVFLKQNGVRFRKPKYDLTKFIVNAYLSLFEVRLDEKAEKVNTGAWKSDQHKHRIRYMKDSMKKEINDLIKKLDDYCKKFPDYVHGYKFPKSLLKDDSVKNMSVVFASEFHKFNEKIRAKHEDVEFSLENLRKRKILDKEAINEFKKYNDSIKEFNEFLRAISLVFRDDVFGDEDTVGEFYFNKNKVTDIFINAMQYRLEYLDVPDKPILEELDIDLDNLLYDPDEDD